MAVVAITATERAAFKRRRRAWDLGARVRRGLQPVAAGTAAGAHAARSALAVHYYPGMWTWDRTIVHPLVLKAAGAAASYMERYVEWAADIDDFEPLRVESDFDARIAHPDRDGDLAAPDGRAVHYQGRVDALVVDEQRDQWLLWHRFGSWTEVELLRLDEAALTAAWAWEQNFLDARVCGVLFNELTFEGEFRRTRLVLSADAVAQAGQQLAAEARVMVDPVVAVYPTPGAHCLDCAFLSPCTMLQHGQDPTEALVSGFEPRPPEELEEGRLGGATWGMGRGAMPPRFHGEES